MISPATMMRPRMARITRAFSPFPAAREEALARTPGDRAERCPTARSGAAEDGRALLRPPAVRAPFASTDPPPRHSLRQADPTPPPPPPDHRELVRFVQHSPRPPVQPARCR